MGFSLDSLLRPELSELAPYVPHTGEFAVRLDANEAPDFWSPSARKRLAKAAGEIALSRYPDATAAKLRASIATRVGAHPDELVLGAGSDEIIALLLTALSRPRGTSRTPILVTVTPTFVMYKTTARARGFQVIEVPLDDRWQLDVRAVRRAVQALDASIIFLASPNNPTGNLMDEAGLREIIESAPESLVVLDEAYGAYASESGVGYRNWLAKYPNVALMGTLSKIGLAALRIGWLRASTPLVLAMNKVRQPYNVPAVCQHVATVALDELSAEIAKAVTNVRHERERLTRELTTLGHDVTPSDANFLWIRTPTPAVENFDRLAARSVLVRSFHARGGRLTRQLRITIGTPAENDQLLAALR